MTKLEVTEGDMVVAQRIQEEFKRQNSTLYYGRPHPYDPLLLIAFARRYLTEEAKIKVTA